jgi:hypothetical protein
LKRLGRLLMLLWLLLWLPPQARAWESTSELVMGTARCLERGAMMVGILTPLGYGITERVTVFTSPIVALLMTPNAQLRVGVWQSPQTAIAVELGYQQSFLSMQQGDKDYPGFVQVGLAWSRTLRRDLQATLGGGYESPFGSAGEESENRVYYRAGLDFLINRSDLLMLRLHGALGFSPFLPTSQTLMAVYAHEFGRAHIGVGLAAGSFPISTSRDSQGAIDKSTRLPVFPWLDFWWSF